MMALHQLIRRCGISTELPTRPFLFPFRASGSQPDGKRVDTRFTPSTLAWITTFGNGLSLNRTFQNGCSPKYVPNLRDHSSDSFPATVRFQPHSFPCGCDNHQLDRGRFYRD